MKFTLIICVFLCASLTEKIYGQDDWELSKQDEGISVYFRMISKKDFEVRVITTFKTTADALTAIIYDAATYPYWVYRCQSAKITTIKGKSYIISITDIPWPFKDREVVNLLYPKKQIDKQTILVQSISKPDAVPKNPDYIRLDYSEVSWEIKTSGTNRIEVDYKLSLKISQEAPEFIIKLISTNGPYESFKNLKQKLTN
ncbi:MAG: hypothetical protein PF448_01965 [Bacteroidales bacterium]|nr:hypothetical protein [Bacteroidales bacterium]